MVPKRKLPFHYLLMFYLNFQGTTFTKYKQFVHNCFKICDRQALHAKSLGFAHPTTKKDVFFDSELAEDMQQLIQKWRKYATHQQL